MSISWASVWAPARLILLSIFSYAVGKGWIVGDNVEEVVSALGTIGAASWAYFETRKRDTKIEDLGGKP